MQSMNRRRFLCAALGAGGLGATGWLTSSRPEPRSPIVRTGRALGTDVSITAYHPHPEIAERGIAAAFAEIDRVENVLSLYRPESQICRLNREGILDEPHAYLVQVLNTAHTLSQRSNGAFDVTVQPLWSLYAAANKGERLPSQAEVEAANGRVDWRRVGVSYGRITLLGVRTEITLNGIAQGFATDRAVDVLRSHGIEHALVNAGEMGPLGTKPKGERWTIGIQHPRRDDAWIALAKLDGRCLATSGDYATTFSPVRSYHHIFDPRTGKSPEHFSSVSVVALTGTEADALSTALFVMPLAAGLELIRKTPMADALVVFKDGRVVQTDGFPAEAA